MQQADINRIVEHTATLLVDRYVFPDIGRQLGELLTEQLAAGRYSAATDPRTLSALVTEDLQSINQDLHLRLKHHDVAIPDLAGEEAMLATMAREAAETMHGIARVERLAGNVAVLAIRPVLFDPSIAGEAIVAAMQLVASADALIIDLRECRGGSPGSVALVCGYLFDEPTHLIDIYEREGDRTMQSWSPPYVPGPRFGASKPVYVLTSRTTFSGGEELSHDLKQHGRATLVGERTGGGAHPRIGERLHPHLEATIPVARACDPVTGQNWEGVGVQPDVEVPAADSLDVAHRAALRTVADDVESPAAAEALAVLSR